VTRSGDGVNYAIDYSYDYDANRPLSKTGVPTFLTGANAGQTFETSAEYSYY
jgi:hypothetical protein